MAISSINVRQHETCAIERTLVALALRELQAKSNTSLAKLSHKSRGSAAHIRRIEATEDLLAKIADVLPAYAD